MIKPGVVCESMSSFSMSKSSLPLVPVQAFFNTVKAQQDPLLIYQIMHVSGVDCLPQRLLQT